jgi:P-type E1-E2 ATPase
MFECYETLSVGSLFGLVNATDLQKGRYVPSSELVPGDIYEVTDPGLGQFPCDSLLLAGDCIVNESMLTGQPSFPLTYLINS